MLNRLGRARVLLLILRPRFCLIWKLRTQVCALGLTGKQKDLRDSMTAIYVGFAFALSGIFTLLAIPFRSYLQPLIVMFAIPFGVFGAIVGHIIMGYNMSIISMMGLLALSGVVVNDSLVLISYANDRRREGLPAAKAIWEAGVRRFRQFC